MIVRTYYDILGVSRDATFEEITTAKNALAKIYHPDANVHKDIDTTALMQEILEAYRVLSDPEKRKEYNRDTFGETDRVFRTFKVGPEDGEEEIDHVLRLLRKGDRTMVTFYCNGEILTREEVFLRTDNQERRIYFLGFSLTLGNLLSLKKA